jgi:hypothetical protein
LYAGYLSPPWLAVFLAFLGLLCGWGERWLFRRCTPARLVLLAGAVTAALAYEGSLPAMLLALRAAAALAGAAWLVGRLVHRPPVGGRSYGSTRQRETAGGVV